MADRRYRHGIFKGNATEAQRTRRQQQALSACNPLNHGWELAYFNTQYNLHVYTLATFKLMRHPDPRQDGWIVEDTITGQQSVRQGSMADITANVKAELPAALKNQQLEARPDSLPEAWRSS